MAKHTIKGYLTWEQWHWEATGKVSFQTWEPDADSEHRSLIREHSIEVEIEDDFDPRPQKIAALDEQIKKTRAEFSARITELQEQKSRLLCIEMAPA